MSLPAPYHQEPGVTLYCGDAREIAPRVGRSESIVTDPVWPNSTRVFPGLDPAALLRDTLEHIEADRVVIQLGCDSDPRFTVAVPERWPFLRACWMEYAVPSYSGRRAKRVQRKGRDMEVLLALNIMGGAAALAIWLSPVVLRRIAAWVLQRAFYLENMNAERKRWRALAEVEGNRLRQEFGLEVPDA